MSVRIHVRKPKNTPNVYFRYTYEDRTRSNWESSGKRTKREARLEAERRLREREAVPAATAQGATSLEGAYDKLGEELERSGSSESTLEIVEQKFAHIMKYFGGERAINNPPFTLQEVTAYVDHRRQSVADATISKEVTWFLAALRICRDLGDYNGPVEKLWPKSLPREFPARKRWLPFDEYRRVLDALREGTQGYHRQQPHGEGKAGGALRRLQLIEHAARMGQDWSDHLVIYVYTGLRFRELYVLRASHLIGDHLYVMGTKTDGAKRVVPLAPDALQVLQRRAATAGPGGVLFPLTSGGKTPKEQLANQKRAWLRALKRACRVAGVAHASTNDCRRTFATWCFQSGVEEAVCIRWMGHESTKMIRQVYGQPTQEQGRREVAKLPSLAGGDNPVMTPLAQFRAN